MSDKITGEQATARKAELLGNGRPGSGDQAFIDRYMKGDTQARAVIDNLHKNIMAPPAPQRAPSAASPPLPADGPRTEDEIEFDSHYGVPRTPDGYHLNWSNMGAAIESTAELAKLDTGARAMLHNMAFPTEIGNSLLDRALRDGERFVALDDDGKELHRRELQSTLARIVPDVEQALKNADAMVAMVKDQAFVQELADKGVFANAAIVTQLHLQCERLTARAAMAKQRGR